MLVVANNLKLKLKSRHTEWRVGFKAIRQSQGLGFINYQDNGQDSFVRISEIATEPIHNAESTELKLKRMVSQESAESSLN